MVRRFAIEKNVIVPVETAGTILVYINPDKDERDYLVKTLNVDEHTLNSSLDPDEISRVEFEADHLAVIFKRPKNYSSADQFLFKVSSVGLFLLKEQLLIVAAEDLPIFDGKPFARVTSLRDIILKLLCRSIIHFLDHLKVINYISDEIEQKVNESLENRYLLNMFSLEKSLVYYLNSIHSNGVVIEKLRMNAVKIGFSQESTEFLDDLNIENAQCYKQAEIYSNILSSLMDARASIISNNLNVMMKNLNALVIAVAVPSFFAGVGGMSEFSNMIGFQNWRVGYGVFVLVMILLGTGTFFAIKKIERFWRI